MGTTNPLNLNNKTNQYYMSNGNCSRYCKHHLNNNSLIGAYSSNIILFDDDSVHRTNNGVRSWNNHSKQFTRAIIFSLLKHGGVLWDLGSGCGLLSMEYREHNAGKVVCIEVDLLRIKTLVYNSKYLGQAVSVYDSGFIDVVIGARLPDRINISCGLKHLWQWRLIYIHVKIAGVILLTGISNITWTNIGILSCVFKTKLFSLTIAKLVLRLNNKIYRIHSAILFCLVEKPLNKQGKLNKTC